MTRRAWDGSKPSGARTRAVDVVAATAKFLANVGDAVKCFQTGNGAEFTNEMFATICRDRTIRHEHAGENRCKHNGVVEHGLGLIQVGGMTACIELSRLFSGQLPDLERFWVGAAIYINDCLNTTVTTANAGHMSSCEAFCGRLPPTNTLAFMQPRFRCVQHAKMSQPKAERRFYLNRRRNHPRDSFKVHTSSDLTSDMWGVTWEIERVPIIAVELGTGTATAPEAWEADWHVRYAPPMRQVPLVLPVTPAMATV